MLDKNKTFLVLNYNGSPVAVSTRHESYIIPGGSSESPSSMPLSVDEIVQINSNSNVFKMGLLWFEEEFQENLYKECRIRNWKDILTDSEIEDIILHISQIFIILLHIFRNAIVAIMFIAICFIFVVNFPS